MTDNPTLDAVLKGMARAIYELNPIMEQAVDCDLRPISGAAPITFDQLLEYDEGIYEAVFEQARSTLSSEALASLLKRAAEALETTMTWTEYETEYDGRTYDICHGCGGQDGIHKPGCNIPAIASVLADLKALTDGVAG